MAKLWDKGEFKLNQKADDFNSSISFDRLLYKEDILGSVAHATNLVRAGVISAEDGDKLKNTLLTILAEIEDGILEIDMSSEDIHTFVEQELTKRLKELGKTLHTARSRNDQVATDLKLYVRTKIDSISKLLEILLEIILVRAEGNLDAIMPGYTHMQRAQPVTFAHHLLAYHAMFKRDKDRLCDLRKRLNLSPLGAAALAGTGFPIDRALTARLLGFSGVAVNSMDAVSDRDYCIELLGVLSIIMMHLSRFSEEIILFCSWEFKFLTIEGGFSTGSSIMPQKKNPDIAELVRGKTGRVYGDLVAMLTVLKALPLTYNKDLQEDKETVFDGINTVESCLNVFIPMLQEIKVNKENMLNACKNGYLNATDLADYLVEKHKIPFRSAYQIAGNIVNYCTNKNTPLDCITLEEFNLKAHLPKDVKIKKQLIEEDIYSYIDMNACVKRRTSVGGAATAGEQIAALRSMDN